MAEFKELNQKSDKNQIKAKEADTVDI